MAKYLRFLSILAVAGVAVLAAEDGKSAAETSPAPSRPSSSMPPVLRNSDPVDNRFVLLPGLPEITNEAKPFVPPSTPSSKTVEIAERHEPAPPELVDPGRPVLRRAPQPVYPEDFQKDSGVFCQRQIGQWKELDAMALLGTPSSDRPAFDDDHKANGRIYAFSDPTNRYKQMELDFDGETGALRSVFLYPWKMTWTDCRRIWGSNVSAADAAKGRKFYSYLNRRVDVLVDPTGKVISIGLY